MIKTKIKETMKLSISLTKKHVFLISLLVLLIGIGIVQAVWPTLGHDYADIKPCSAGQILESTDTGWTCGTDDVGPPGGGDITGVNAGSGLSGGGDSDTVTLNLLANTASCTSGKAFNSIDFRSGATTCVDMGSGSSQWKNDDSNIYYDLGAVRIWAGADNSGLADDAGELYVGGDIEIDGDLCFSGPSTCLKQDTNFVTKISNTLTGSGKNGLLIETKDDAFTTDVLMVRSNTQDKFYVTGNGQVFSPFIPSGTGTDLYYSSTNGIVKLSSSQRYKENIKELQLGLNTVEQLKPVTFNWKSSHEKDLGLIAEEVEKVDPLLVTYNEKNQVEGVKYSQLTVVLVNAMKEQQAQIEQLKKENEEQKKSLWSQHNEIIQLKKAICEINPNSGICD